MCMCVYRSTQYTLVFSLQHNVCLFWTEPKTSWAIVHSIVSMECKVILKLSLFFLLVTFFVSNSYHIMI